MSLLELGRSLGRLAFGSSERENIAEQLAELERGLVELDAPVLAERCRDLSQRASHGEDVTPHLRDLLEDHDKYLGVLDAGQALRAHCLSRGWLDLADEYTVLMADWDGSTKAARATAMQRLNIAMQRRLAGGSRHAGPPAERIIERQILVRRCPYCAQLTPVDLTACACCGARG